MARTYRSSPARRILNRFIKLVLRTPFGPPHFYLLTVPGRRSRRPHTTPVRLIEDETERWLVAPYGEVAWVRNARAAGQVELRRGRRTEQLRIEEVGAVAAGPVLRRYVQQVPVTRPYFDADKDSRADAFAAEADRHPVFRLTGA